MLITLADVVAGLSTVRKFRPGVQKSQRRVFGTTKDNNRQQRTTTVNILHKRGSAGVHPSVPFNRAIQMTGPQLDHREDIHAHNPHSPLPSHYPLSCQPTDLNEFNYSNQPSQRIFPLALVGPGPDLNPLPHPQPQHQFDTGAASTSNHGKRRRNLPGENHRRNAAYDVWAFVRPLASAEPPPEGQWPTPPSPHITSKPKTRWFGCVLCSEFGWVIWSQPRGGLSD